MKLNKNIIYGVLLLLLLGDIGYSFVQHLSIPLDGDMAAGIIPAKDVQHVLNDPLGISVITKNEVYPNPNRFFAHYSFYQYFKHVPLILQHYVTPINSIYLACAIAKIAIQLLILVLLAMYITGSNKLFSKQIVLACVLISPLFQTNGYQPYMGIIDQSITYTFFYALPCALLLLMYLPFFNTMYHQQKFSNAIILKLFLVVLTFVVTLNGPLLPGIILVITTLVILNGIHKISKTQLFFFVLLSLLSVYSLYIGLNNSIFVNEEVVPIPERYYRLPLGLYYVITQKIGYPILLLMLVINTYIIAKFYKTDEGKKLLNIFKWIGLFSLLYILLLPLGGYKSYRPNILRYDTIMPVTLALIFMYGSGTYYLINNLNGNNKKWYVAIVIIFSILFTFADAPEFNKNNCERNALHQLAQAKDTVVVLNNNCEILSWTKIHDPNASQQNAQLLTYWHVTQYNKRYYQKQPTTLASP
ncbi:MAG: hypothetical protein ABL940_08510 [Bacteroidia bacterium]